MRNMRTDRRTQYTKKVIREAFLQLIKKKPVQKITVADICALAEVSRPTFYLHYADVYALLDEICDGMLESANLNEMTQLSIDEPNSIRRLIVNLVRIIENNIDVYKLCVLDRGISTRLPRRIAEELESTIIKKWEEEGMLKGAPDRSYLIDFIQGAFNSLIRCRYEKREEERESPEELAAIIETFLLYGLSGFVG